jgi:hypothetical protein
MPIQTAQRSEYPTPADLEVMIAAEVEARQDYLLAKAEREAAEANGTDTKMHYYSEVSCFDYWQDLVTDVAITKDYLAETGCASEREGYCPASAWSSAFEGAA